MVRHEKGAGGDRPLRCSLGGEHPQDSHRRSRIQLKNRPPATSGIMSSLITALADSGPDDRVQVLRWVAAKGLLGLANEQGFRAAAECGYRLADELAGAVR